MSTPKVSFTNHHLLEAELSPKVNIAMSTEELPDNGSDNYTGEVRMDWTRIPGRNKSQLNLNIFHN